MKSNLPSIPTLRNGLTVAFEDITYSRAMLGSVTVHGFVVILGNVLRIGAHELWEANESLFREVSAIAWENAEEMVYRAKVDARERSAWFNARR